MCYFRTHEIFVRAIIGDLRFADHIMQRNTPAIGKRAKNAVRILSQRCTSGTARMNTILKSIRIRRHLSQPIVPNVANESSCLTGDIPSCVVCTVAIIAPLRKKSAEKLFRSIGRNSMFEQKLFAICFMGNTVNHSPIRANRRMEGMGMVF